MTNTEMAIMVTLGGIVSVPMQSPERGLVQGIVILACVLLFQYSLGRLSFKSHRVEITVQGDLSLLVKDGKIQVDQLKMAGISQQTLFSQLRTSNVQHLGQVKRLYLEACGKFSLIPFSNPVPGLSVLPDKDEKIRDREVRSKDFYSCAKCGNTIESKASPDQTCDNCGGEKWFRSVLLRSQKAKAVDKFRKEAVEKIK
jgi:uncharacterized membrane protein YcaP (DUF421 family)